jgi:hypothetical protein
MGVSKAISRFTQSPLVLDRQDVVDLSIRINVEQSTLGKQDVLRRFQIGIGIALTS